MASMKDYSPLVPFDLYDFFGYLFPGILFAANIGFFLYQVCPSLWGPFHSSATGAGVGQADLPFLFALALVVAGTVVLYSLGHFVAIISYVIIDRVLIDGIEGYPILFQLSIEQPKRDYSESTFKYLFALFNLFLLLPMFIADYHALRWTIGILLCAIAVLIFQRFVIMFVRTTAKGRALSHKVGDKPVIRLFLLPSKLLIDPVIGFFRRLLGLDRQLPASLVALYKSLFEKRYPPLQSDNVESENYWLSAFHAIADHETHERTLHTWLHLYGFARNASAAFSLSAALILGHVYFHAEAYTIATRVHLGILWCLAVALGLRYWVLYSKYYTKGVVRAFVESVTR
jgi:hypothetical protein